MGPAALLIGHGVRGLSGLEVPVSKRPKLDRMSMLVGETGLKCWLGGQSAIHAPERKMVWWIIKAV